MLNGLGFVVFQEEGVWVAHGLQHNIVTHGECLSEVRENIDLVVEGYILKGGVEAIKRVPRADSRYWEMYVEAIKAGRDLDAYLDAPVEEASAYKLELQPA